MVSKSYLDGFIPAGTKQSECIKCGICLQKCPVMKMGKEEAKAEISRLLNGEETRRVLNECTFCFTCNHYCPNGLTPYHLIMERMSELNRRNRAELHPFAIYMINGRNEPGFFNAEYENGSDNDKAVLKRWSEIPARSNEILFIGCAGRITPSAIEHLKVLKELPKFGPRDICCGDIPYRFGDYKAFSEIAEKAFNRLSLLKTDRLICYCPSCANYFGNIWPRSHGLRLPFKIISLYEWIWEKYQQGEFQIHKKINQDILLSDSCHAGELGDGFMNAVRGLYEAAGMRVVELKNNRHDSLCCGFASYMRGWGNQEGVKKDTQRKMEQIIETGVNDVSFNCHGCKSHLTPEIQGTNIKLHLALDDILEAFGGIVK
jgi:Fe-S oxidoreductase